MSQVLRLCTALGLALCLTSCGTLSFRKAWSEFEAGGSGNDMQGRWKGTWESQWNGHSGGLRCLMTRQDDGTFLAWFHSTFAFVLSFQYETVFTVVEEIPEHVRFEGQEDLGKMIGGIYRYAGTVAGDTFYAQYAAENGDHGVFEMERQ